MPAQPPQVAKATLTALPGGTPLTVHFNPASLVYSVENTVSQQSGGPTTTQYVAQFSGKLSMDLQFDTTDSGSDVRIYTNQVALFMQATATSSSSSSSSPSSSPSASSATGLGDLLRSIFPDATGAPAQAPKVLSFQWGSYEFRGVMDSFKETIDFFSADGVALRALVSIGLSRQDKVFDEGASLSGPSTSGSLVPSSGTDSALSMATRGGDPAAGRALGASNGLASLRFTGGASIQIGGGAKLNPPAAFVTAPSAAAGLSLGVGISGGGSAGISLGGSAGISTGAGASVGGLAPAFGASASAGVPATAGAFAGLQTGRAQTSTTANLNPMQMLTSTAGTSVSASGTASFSLGGAANNAGSNGLSTNVGTQFSFRDRLTFNSDH